MKLGNFKAGLHRGHMNVGELRRSKQILKFIEISVQCDPVYYNYG